MAKRCSRCLEWKSQSHFFKDRTKRDGYRSHCRACQTAAKREYRQRVRVQILTRLRREYLRTWKPRHPQPVDITRTRAFQRWRQKRQESRQLYVSRYLKRWHSLSSAESKRLVPPRREVASTASQRIRAAAYASPVNDLKPEEWAWLQEAYQGCCAYCGESCTNLTPDHVIPLSRGGANTLSNIVPACPACNNRKNARTPAEAGMLPIINIDLSTKLQQLSLF